MRPPYSEGHAGVGRQIFISYSHRDAQLVAAIRDALLSLRWTHDVAVWQDHRNIPVGDDWEQALYDNVTGSTLVVACISFNYLASDMCKWEWGVAVSAGVALVPCLVRPTSLEGSPFAGLQLAVRGRPLPQSPDDPNARDHWLSSLVKDVKDALGQRAVSTTPARPGRRPRTGLALALARIDEQFLHAAFELCGQTAEADPAAQLVRLHHQSPASVAPILIKLKALVPTFMPPPRIQPDESEDTIVIGYPGGRPPPPPPPPPPPADEPPVSEWVRYWTTRLDRIEPWEELTRDVRRSEKAAPDKAYLLVGAPNQEPRRLVERIGSFLPGQVTDAAKQPAVVVVPFPDPEGFVTDTALGVQKLVVRHLRSHPALAANLRPGPQPRSPRLVLAQAARRMPMVVVLGNPLTKSALPQLRGLEEFGRTLIQFLGTPDGRWPVRLIIAVEETQDGSIHRRLTPALRASRVRFRPFDPLHFPPWREVYHQLCGEDMFAGLSSSQLEQAEDAYRQASLTSKNLTRLSERLLATLEQLRKEP